jgi:hypothetical protein
MIRLIGSLLLAVSFSAYGGILDMDISGNLRAGSYGALEYTEGGGTPPGEVVYEIVITTVSGYGASCDQTFDDTWTESEIEDELNGVDADRIFCYDPDDYTGHEEYDITASGTSSDPRWIRLSGVGTTHPVDLQTAEEARITGLKIDGDNWVVHRLTIDGDSGDQDHRVKLFGDGHLIDRVLVENCDATTAGNSRACVEIDTSADTTVQNSVIRETKEVPTEDAPCLSVTGGTSENIHIVRNEIYDCAGDSIIVNDDSSVPGFAAYDNDIYVTTGLYCDSNGDPNASGLYSSSKNAVNMEGGGTSESPAKIIHNRIWGFKDSNTSCGSSGSNGEAIAFNEGASSVDYILVGGNIIEDAPIGVSCGGTTNPNNISIWGNLFNNNENVGDGTGYMANMDSCDKAEVYFNTFSNTTDYWLKLGADDQDYRCNLIVDGIDKNGSAGSNVTADYNAFYGSSSQWTTGSNDYCDGGAGCDVVDADVSNYIYYRKLLTGTEQATINDIVSHSTSPHKDSNCPADNITNSPSIGHN